MYAQVKLQVKFAVGYCPARLAIEEARNLNTRWILLDRYLIISWHSILYNKVIDPMKTSNFIV